MDFLNPIGQFFGNLFTPSPQIVTSDAYAPNASFAGPVTSVIPASSNFFTSLTDLASLVTNTYRDIKGISSGSVIPAPGQVNVAKVDTSSLPPKTDTQNPLNKIQTFFIPTTQTGQKDYTLLLIILGAIILLFAILKMKR